MMIGFKMAFGRHLGGLGSHLGAQKVGRDFPTCEQRAGPTAKPGAKGPQGIPKASKIVKMGSKWGPKQVQKWIRFGVLKKSISHRFLDQFSIKKTDLNLIDFAKIWWLD